jgi:hypothetical protein
LAGVPPIEISRNHLASFELLVKNATSNFPAFSVRFHSFAQLDTTSSVAWASASAVSSAQLVAEEGMTLGVDVFPCCTV